MARQLATDHPHEVIFNEGEVGKVVERGPHVRRIVLALREGTAQLLLRKTLKGAE